MGEQPIVGGYRETAFYRCPACGATGQRGVMKRGKALKCYRCGMLMLEVV